MEGIIHWNSIDSQADIDMLMNIVNSFHDSCVKEIRYLSGAFVDEDLSMYPVNSLRQISILIQTQKKNNSVIELQFEGVRCMTLCPQSDYYTSEILEATFTIQDEIMIWSDHIISFDNVLENMNAEEGIVVVSKNARWRFLDGYLGSDHFYKESIK